MLTQVSLVLCNFVEDIMEEKVKSRIKRLAAIIQVRYKAAHDSKLGVILRNKYVLTLILFFLWILIFDQNNLAERKRSSVEYEQLLEDKAYYIKKIEEDRKRIEELKTDNENLEKFAREQYLMKKDNEDIFLIIEEE